MSCERSWAEEEVERQQYRQVEVNCKGDTNLDHYDGEWQGPIVPNDQEAG